MPKPQMPDEKGEEVENWQDFAEKIGSNVLEVKRQADGLWEKLKDNFKR